jgi:hypothetical protein
MAGNGGIVGLRCGAPLRRWKIELLQNFSSLVDDLTAVVDKRGFDGTFGGGYHAVE